MKLLYLNTAGYYNTANGFGALYNNTNGGNNTADGVVALAQNTSGANNVAMGYAAMNGNTVGNDNVAVGYLALYSGTNLYYSTAVGYQALENAVNGANPIEGNYNTAVGYLALNVNTTGYYNTAEGAYALENNSYGYENTATGVEALEANSSGSGNTADGAEALINNGIGGDNTASGAGALYYNTSGNFNTADGGGALQDNQTGGNNTAVGDLALQNLGAENAAGGSFNIAIGQGAGYFFENNESYNIDIGNGGVAGESGIIRIGQDGVQTACYLAGTVYANGTFVSSSDRNAKENFQSVNAREVLDKVAAMPVSRWNYKQDAARQTHRPHGPGLLLRHNAGPDDTHITTIDEGGVALAAIQGLNQKLEETQQAVKAKDGEIQTLKQQNESLAQRLNELEAAVTR